MSSTSLMLTDCVVQQAPIHGLNTDVLLYIFTICRDVEPVYIWNISRVCNRWRTGTTRALDVVIDMLNLSGQKRPYYRDILDTLLALGRQAHRWRSFIYLLDRWALIGAYMAYRTWDELEKSEFIANFRSMPVLRSIRLVQDDTPVDLHRLDITATLSPQHIYSLIQHAAAPQLHSVSLCNIDASGQVPLHKVDRLSYGTTVDLAGEISSVQSVLRTYPALRSLQLFGQSLVVDHDGSPFVLEALEELHVEESNWTPHMLAAMDMPHLTKLTVGLRTLRHRECQYYAGTCCRTREFLDGFSIGPHASQLKVLSLSLGIQHVPWFVIVCFNSLETLRVTMPSESIFKLKNPKSLRAVSRKAWWSSEDSELTWGFSQLRTLVLETIGPYGFDETESDTGMSQLGTAFRSQFQDRWAAAQGKEKIITLLDIDIICSDCKVEVRAND
ncbi:hypothetical protein CALVIDRAFT_556155 [Calocera viscosa TUFC12733]|uniref:F-box domain-containing protein n=1 Tax=Calocera viscosa (strain TUFC12733) TaxID=1330018 RepID=A0A167KGF4_CALVF|nr:hypothetical protein CALVIDRAFT_556155 [Calocera viscosa TUFC12733]